METAGVAQFVLCAERWRRQLRLTHTEFLAYVGRTAENGGRQAQTEWWLLRTGRRTPSTAFARLVLRKAREVDPVWADLLEAAHSRDGLAKVA